MITAIESLGPGAILYLVIGIVAFAVTVLGAYAAWRSMRHVHRPSAVGTSASPTTIHAAVRPSEGTAEPG